MRKFNLIATFIFAFALSVFSLTACGGDEDEPKKDGDNPTVSPDDPTVVDPTDPVDQKSYMETTAKNFLNYFNPNDQKDLLEVINTFVSEYADYEAPDNYDFAPAVGYAKHILKVFGNGNYLASSQSDDIYRFSQYTGHYKVQGDSWVKIADSDDIQFLFLHEGTSCALTATKSGNEWSVEDDGVVIYVPSTVVVTVTKGKTTLLTTTVNSSYNEAGHKASVKVSVKANNYDVYAECNVTDTKITENQSFTIGGNELITTTATVTGNNLGNRSKITDLIESDNVENELDNYITGATASINILDRVLIQSTGDGASSVVKAMDYDDESEKDTKKTANILNNHLITSFYYDKGTVKQGTIQFEAFLDEEWYNYKYYSIRPILKFASDSTTYDFESYFGNGKFDSVETLFSNLLDKYSDIIDF